MTPRQRERAAAALIEAATVAGAKPGQADQEVGKRHGVSARQMRRWRKALENDPELAALVREKKAKVEQGWAEQLPGSIRSAIDFLRRAAETADAKSPAAIHSVAGALKILTDVAATWRILDHRIAKGSGQTPAPAPGGEPKPPGAPVIPIDRSKSA